MQPTEADYQAIKTVFDQFSNETLIDKYNLDQELVEQADKFRRICDATALSMSYLGAAKAEVEKVQGEVDQIVRDRSEKDRAAAEERGDRAPARLTETAVRSMVQSDGDYIAAKNDLLRWTEMHSRLQGLQSAWTQRQSMLKELPALFLAGYYARNSVIGSPAQQSANLVRENLVRLRNESRDREQTVDQQEAERIIDREAAQESPAPRRERRRPADFDDLRQPDFLRRGDKPAREIPDEPSKSE